MPNKRLNTSGDVLLSNLRYRRKWKGITSILAIFVVICTIGSLMLPAITMSDGICGLDEHIHTEKCYQTSKVPSLSCHRDTLGIHSYSSNCMDVDSEMICNQVDFVVHTHDGACWDADDALVCSLSEIKEHIHIDNCYLVTETIIDEGHFHDDSCYEWVTSETTTCGIQESPGHAHSDDCFTAETALTCTEPESAGHVHGNTCYKMVDTLACGAEESLGHSHDDGYYGEDGALACGLDETSGHTHGTGCYTQTAELICDEPESMGHSHDPACYIEAGTLLCSTEETPSHQHSEECYALVKGNLICNKEEREPVIEAGEPELICEEPEVVLHTHKGTCYEYDAQGNPVSLICGMPEVIEHQHTEICFTETEVQNLICQIPEHTHTFECKDSSDLTEEEQAQVDALILVIDSLPSAEEVTAQLAVFDEAGDTAGLDAYTTALLEQLSPIFDQYDALTGEQRSAVTNAADLMALEWLLPEEDTLPALSEEERAQVEEVITEIDALPDPETLTSDLDAFTEARDLTGWETTVTDTTEKVQALRTRYDALSEQQKEAVSNIQKLTSLETLLAGLTEPELTEEEKKQVEDVILLIDGLQDAQEVKNEIAQYESLGDLDSLALYKEKMVSAVSYAQSCYDALSGLQKKAVINSEKLKEYDFLFADSEKEDILTTAGNGFTLAASGLSEAGLPEGATLYAQPILPEDPLFENYRAEVDQILDGPKALDMWLYDIGFSYEETPVEPAGEVTLQMDLESPLDIPDAICYLAVHFGESGPEILPVETLTTDGYVTGFVHSQSNFSPTAYVAVGPTDNPSDIGPDWLPVEYYVHIDGEWTLVGSTKTGWYGTKTAADAWTNENRDNITVEQVLSILGPYGFTEYSDGQSAFSLFYQRRNQSDYNLHNDTKCYIGPSRKPTIPLARNVVDSMGYNLYYSPATTAEDHRALSALTIPDGSKFYTVSVLDANHLVYAENEELPEPKVFKNESTSVSMTVKTSEYNWKWTTADGNTTLAAGTDNGDGTTTYSYDSAITKPLTLSPGIDNLANATASNKPVHFMVWLDDAWTEVGSVETAYYMEGYCKGSNDNAGNARYRWFITTEQAYSVLAPFGFDPANITIEGDTIKPSKDGEIKCMYFMHQTGSVNTSGKDVYSSGNWDRLPDGKTWAIGMSYNNQEYTMYYVPGNKQYYQGNGDRTHTADIFAETAANLDGSRFYSVTVRDDNQLVYSADVTAAMTQYVAEGGTATVSVTNGDGVMWSGNIKDLTPFQDENTTTFTFENINQPIVVSATEADPVFTVQYYGTVVQYVTSGGTGEALKVIDTSGKKLPKNGGTHKTLNIYLEDSTESAPSYSTNTYLKQVETKDTVTKLYTEESFHYEEYPGVAYVDKLADNECYAIQAVGVLKEGKSPDTQNNDDFDWYYFNDAKDNILFTNILSDAVQGPEVAPASDKHHILITSGTVLRFVYDAVSEDDSFVNKAIFHDYDITDGTKNSAGEIKVGVQQINSRAYYLDPSRTVAGDRQANGLTGVYAFGNVNCRTGLGRALWNGNELNKYNNRNSDVEGTTFGLVTGFDSNNNVTWNSGINAPVDLFSSNPRPGKTTYNGGSLTFNRVGDTYTLTAANSTAGSRSNLEYFFTPVNDTSTRTNNFWVLDKASNLDAKVGSTQHPAYGYNDYSHTANELPDSQVSGLKLPPSDDLRNHNWFFGMNFAISFNLTEDYEGPLDYLFFGDDDLWVFLDDQLICDIGGVHISVGEYVNLRDYLPVGSSGQHTLSFFYTERGASGSTCWMSFTLPSVTSATTGRDIGGLEISKMVVDNNGGNANGDFLGDEYLFDVALKTSENGAPLAGTYSYRTVDINRKITYGTIKNGGTLKLGPGDILTISGLPAGAWYEITEQAGSREGFTVTVNGGSGYIAKGSIATGTLTDAHFINHMHVELPETGSAGTPLFYVIGGLITLAALGLLLSKKRIRTDL